MLLQVSYSFIIIRSVKAHSILELRARTLTELEVINKLTSGTYYEARKVMQRKYLN